MTHTYFHFDGFEVQADTNAEGRWANLIGTAPSIEATTVSYGRAAVRWSVAAASGSLRLYSERDNEGQWVDDADRDPLGIMLDTARMGDALSPPQRAVIYMEPYRVFAYEPAASPIRVSA